MTTRILKSLLIAALVTASAAHAADDTIRIAMEDGKPRAEFKMGDSRCVLADDQIRCTPVKQ
jgi:hypothetical protein